MISNIVKGGDMKGLMRYLTGPGRANEHVRPHIVASDGFPSQVFAAELLDRTAAEEIADYVEAPRELFGTTIRTQVSEQDPETGERVVLGMRDAHVWHCSLSVAAKEGPLSEETWEGFASDFMDKMGFTEESGKSPCRWVAIHHGASKSGNDHIHIAASMVREDGTKWDGRMRDFTRARDACRELETKYGLAHPPNYEAGVSVRGEQPAEQRQAAELQLPATAPKLLAERLRGAAVASSSEAEWVRRVRADGVVVKPFYAKGTTDVVAGYRAALKPENYNDKLVFYGGGKLGKDLSLPRLRERWGSPGEQETTAATAEWHAAFAGRAPAAPGQEGAGLDKFRPDAQLRAAQRLGEMHDRLQQVPIGDHGAWSDAARDASGVLSAWARFDKENAPEFRAAAQELSRSAQVPRRAEPAGSRTKGGARGAALILAAAAAPGSSSNKSKVVAAMLMRQLIKTAEALRDNHQVNGRLRQARAVQVDVVDRLRRVSLVGYQSEEADARQRAAGALSTGGPGRLKGGGATPLTQQQPGDGSGRTPGRGMPRRPNRDSKTGREGPDGGPER
ncbi:relaxase/mobilization nuclease domain-containing protein [Nocardioides lijunqiniae]|uniref:relaxase/mobilization nuclease domain-containing protein n=1 Tax=Nocardioides lijunqiniae TaxID=2760832 RepID=UPI001878841B|nr:relaxase/mobilization nuclease domain-containing protein [Nocardioides lijunqiniae]